MVLGVSNSGTLSFAVSSLNELRKNIRGSRLFFDLTVKRILKSCATYVDTTTFLK